MKTKDGKQLYSKEEIKQTIIDLKQKEQEYNQTIAQKPNVKKDGIIDVVEWLQQLLTIMKK